MDMIKGVVGGVIAGLIGAGIWGAIAYFTGYEVGIVAWLIGGLVGFGVAAASGGNTGAMTGMVAAVIALASIAGGRYGVIHAMTGVEMKKVLAEVKVDDDEAQKYMASDLLAEAIEGGKSPTWPEGKDEDSAATLDDYPADIAKDVRARYAAMDPQDQTAYKAAISQELKQNVAGFRDAISQQAFMESFGALDFLFAGLALFTAFRVGSGSASDGE